MGLILKQYNLAYILIIILLRDILMLSCRLQLITYNGIVQRDFQSYDCEFFVSLSIIVICPVCKKLTELRSQVPIKHSSYPGGPNSNISARTKYPNQVFLELPNEDWDSIWVSHGKLFSSLPNSYFDIIHSYDEL
jgi:hypothetical protein